MAIILCEVWPEVMYISGERAEPGRHLWADTTKSESQLCPPCTALDSSSETESHYNFLLRWLDRSNDVMYAKYLIWCRNLVSPEVIILLLSSSRASLITQLAKNPPSMQETQVRFLGREDLLEKGCATHSSILGLPSWLSW